MTRVRLPLILLLLLGPAGPAHAGKGYSGSSSGGKSFSSGGKSYSSGGKSYSSGSSSSGKGSSSGSSSRPSSGSSTGSRPSPSSSPSSRPPSRPSTSSYDSAAGAAARHSDSRSAFERRSSPNTPGVPASGSTGSGKWPGGKSYSSANSRSSGPTYTPGTPRTNYNDARGQSRTVNPNDPRVGQLRRDMNEDRWFSRSQRSRNIFINVGPPFGYPVVYYSDPYSNLFWWWMLSRSLDDRAYWAYNHRYDMDPLRYRDLIERDRALEARVRELEARQTPRDRTFAPPGVDPDLMYNDEYVEAAVNPTITYPDEPRYRTTSGGRHLGRSCFTFLLAVGIIAFLIWFIFIKRWGGSEPVQGRRIRP